MLKCTQGLVAYFKPTRTEDATAGCSNGPLVRAVRQAATGAEFQVRRSDIGGGEAEAADCYLSIAVAPERQFVVSAREKHKDLVIALGAGHGTKSAPTIGRVAAELTLDGRTEEEI